MSSFRHVGITVSDLDRSIKFYEELLGFEVKKVMLENGDDRAKEYIRPSKRRGEDVSNFFLENDEYFSSKTSSSS